MSSASQHGYDLIGSFVGRYRLTARLGAGGMGEVFLADDPLLKRQVAIKAVPSSREGEPTYRERLLKEAERASQLVNEHIVAIHDLIERGDELFLVMEYVRGETLRRHMQSELGTAECLRIIEQALIGTAAAHARGIFHCDLKPENLVVTVDGSVKVLDFGLARLAPTVQAQSSASTITLSGTLSYMAPEVLLGKPPSAASDVFALGVVFHELIAGTHPFDSGSVIATAEKILRQPTPAARRPDQPPGLDILIRRMLEKDPALRYQDCAEVLGDLHSIIAGGRPSPAAVRRVPRFSAIRVVALAAAVLLVAGGYWLFQRITSPAAVSASNRQLVVLPIKPLSDDAASRAFSNGLTDTLTSKLGQFTDKYPLEVLPSSSVTEHKVASPEQARTVLGAGLALEGSMQQAGDLIRINYALVDTHTMRQLHSGVITADAHNPFAVQDRVVSEVLDSLNIELAGADRTRLSQHGTSNAEAYTAYLRGRGYMQEYAAPENVDHAIDLFQRALALDPHYALAAAALGEAYAYKGSDAHNPQLLQAAAASCSQAMSLDSTLAEAQLCTGDVLVSQGKYEQAVPYLQRVIELDPTLDRAYISLSHALERQGRLTDAESLLQRAIALRPQHWSGYNNLAVFYYTHGRYADAAAQFRKVTEIAPDSFLGYGNLGGVLGVAGKYEEAIAALQKSIAIRPMADSLSNLGVMFFYKHDFVQAADAYRRAQQLDASSYVTAGNLGECYDQLPGRSDDARTAFRSALTLAEAQLKINPRDASTLSYAAMYAARTGGRTLALQYASQARTLQAKEPEVLKNIAKAYLYLGDQGRASATLSQAVTNGLPQDEVRNDPVWKRIHSKR